MSDEDANDVERLKQIVRECWRIRDLECNSVIDPRHEIRLAIAAIREIRNMQGQQYTWTNLVFAD
jgi:hypothetical protein